MFFILFNQKSVLIMYFKFIKKIIHIKVDRYSFYYKERIEMYVSKLTSSDLFISCYSKFKNLLYEYERSEMNPILRVKIKYSDDKISVTALVCLR